MSSIGPSLSSNTSPSLPLISSPVPPRWTPSPSLSPLFISSQSPPLPTSSVLTWTTADVDATAPLSPVSIVTLQNERSVPAPLLLFLSLIPSFSFFQCDRKRPCQRCIQLGLVITVSSLSPSRLVILTHIHSPSQTGLCVYEIDDPSIRFV